MHSTDTVKSKEKTLLRNVVLKTSLTKKTLANRTTHLSADDLSYLPEISNSAEHNETDSVSSESSIYSELSSSSSEYQEQTYGRLEMAQSEKSSIDSGHSDFSVSLPNSIESEKQNGEDHTHNSQVRKDGKQREYDAAEGTMENVNNREGSTVEQGTEDESDYPVEKQCSTQTIQKITEPFEEQLVSFDVLAEDEVIAIKAKKTDTVADIIKV